LLLVDHDSRDAGLIATIVVLLVMGLEVTVVCFYENRRKMRKHAREDGRRETREDTSVS
jgi:hypothetical protein